MQTQLYHTTDLMDVQIGSSCPREMKTSPTGMSLLGLFVLTEQTSVTCVNEQINRTITVKSRKNLYQ